MPWPASLSAAGGVTEGDDMTLENRIRRMEEQHSETGERSLAVIMQFGETEEDAITRTIMNFQGKRSGKIIVVPAKRAIVPDP